nr:hypothetical protein [Tanacetum cinerariifolium]
MANLSHYGSDNLAE